VFAAVWEVNEKFPPDKAKAAGLVCASAPVPVRTRATRVPVKARALRRRARVDISVVLGCVVFKKQYGALPVLAGARAGLGRQRRYWGFVWLALLPGGYERLLIQARQLQKEPGESEFNSILIYTQCFYGGLLHKNHKGGGRGGERAQNAVKVQPAFAHRRSRSKGLVAGRFAPFSGPAPACRAHIPPHG
jgi:hypothetical protein